MVKNHNDGSDYALLQDGNDLLWAVSCAFHWCSPLMGSENHILGGPVFGGYVTGITVFFLQGDSQRGLF